jgi:hypothetical protein
MSLPLPRPVGVEAEEELLVAKLREESGTVENRAEREEAVKRALAGQLPEGMEVLAVELLEPGASFQPQSAEYGLPLRTEEEAGLAERLQHKVAEVMQSDRCVVERAFGAGQAARPVDVRPFLLSVHLESGALTVQHRTGEGGSIRVEEILRLFGLSLQDLAGLCDSYLFLVGGQPTLLKAHEITAVGPVTAALLTDIFDKLRGGPPSLRIAS